MNNTGHGTALDYNLEKQQPEDDNMRYLLHDWCAIQQPNSILRTIK